MALNSIDLQVKEFALLTKTQWSVWLEHSGQAWHTRGSYGVTKPAQKRLLEFLGEPLVHAWLSGSISQRRIRHRAFSLPGKKSKKIFAFPGANNGFAILVGADTLDDRAIKMWRALALSALQKEQDRELRETVVRLQETRQELQATIDAQHETEQRLIQAAKLAAVGEMAAGVAHELNNPMTTVVGFTEMILADLPEDSPYKMDLALVLREARRAVSVVRRLLDFSRQNETTRVKADVNELVEETLALTRHLLRTDGIDVAFRSAPNLPWVLVDRNQIKQVILNLISNAQHAMPSGGRLIIETALQKMRGQDGVIIALQDSGIGISQENLARIFEPFFTTRGDHGGTGLGLSVTYGIISEHRGMIEVESVVNAGSTFRVWLPLETISA
jgi:signal transduction histidine kinase